MARKSNNVRRQKTQWHQKQQPAFARKSGQRICEQTNTHERCYYTYVAAQNRLESFTLSSTERERAIVYCEPCEAYHVGVATLST